MNIEPDQKKETFADVQVEDVAYKDASSPSEVAELPSENIGFKGEAEHWDTDTLAKYEVPEAERKQLLRTLDLRIAPMVMILYLIAFLDRSNIGKSSKC